MAALNDTWFTVGQTAVTPLLLAALLAVIALVWWLSGSLEHWINRAWRRRHPDAPASSAQGIARLVRYVALIVGLLIGFSELGFDSAALTLFGGAVGVGLGFGLQTLFANVISGVVLLLERSLKIGDFVDLQSGVVGTVSEIGLRYTRITTNDNVDHIVPNAEFVNGRVVNWTWGDRSRRIHVPFSVAYGSDKDVVRAAGIAAALSVEGTLNTPGREPEVWLVQLGDNGMGFELVVWLGHTTVSAPRRTGADYLWTLETELRQRGVEIPFPQRDLHLRGGTLDVRVDSVRGTS